MLPALLGNRSRGTRRPCDAVLSHTEPCRGGDGRLRRQPLSWSAAFRAIGSRGGRLRFRSSPTTTAARGCGEQTRAKGALYQPRNVDIDIQRRPRQRIASWRDHDRLNLRCRCALQAGNDPPRYRHRPTTTEFQLNGISVRIVASIHDRGRIFCTCFSSRTCLRISLTVLSHNLTCCHESSSILA
jgi:hypothetical protein